MLLIAGNQETGTIAGTVTGSDAQRFYDSLGWTKAGIVPNYALMPNGAPCATTIFYKRVPGND
jgi:hypothetical protein